MSVAPPGGQNRIMIYGPKDDGTYIVEFRTAAGEALAISIPRSERFLGHSSCPRSGEWLSVVRQVWRGVRAYRLIKSSSSLVRASAACSTVNSFGIVEATIFKYVAGSSRRTIFITPGPCSAKSSLNAWKKSRPSLSREPFFLPAHRSLKSNTPTSHWPMTSSANVRRARSKDVTM